MLASPIRTSQVELHLSSWSGRKRSDGAFAADRIDWSDAVHKASEELNLALLQRLWQFDPDRFREQCHLRKGATLPITKAVRSQLPETHERLHLRCDVVDLLVEASSPLPGALVFAAWRGHERLVLHLLDKHGVGVDGRV